MQIRISQKFTFLCLILGLFWVLGSLSSAWSAEKIKMSLWIFARWHEVDDVACIKDFERMHPNVEIQYVMMEEESMYNKLAAAFVTGMGAPDLAAISNIGMGRFFKGKVEEVGLVDLTERVKKGGYWDKVPEGRWVQWMKGDRIFGVPHDLHPHFLIYRKDIFEQGGIDISQLRTWNDFVEVGKKTTKDLDGDGEIDQYMTHLSGIGGTEIDIDIWKMLGQRTKGANYFDKDHNMFIDSWVAIDTFKFYCDLFNKYHIATAKAPSIDMQLAALKNGLVVSQIMPDWEYISVKESMPEMAGKWRVALVPRWITGSTTWTEEGTSYSITKQCKDIDMAWEFYKYAYLNPETRTRSIEKGYLSILPCTKDSWKDPFFHEPDPFLGGQSILEMLLKSAPDIPAIYTTSYTPFVRHQMEIAIVDALEGSKTSEEALKWVGEKVREAISEKRFGEL